MYIHNYTGYQTSINTSQLVQGNVHISSSTKCFSETAITADIAPVTKQTHLQQLIPAFVIHVLPGLVLGPQAPINLITAVKTCSHMHLRLMHPSSTCTDEWCSTASTLPLSLPCKKALKLSLNYAQNEIQNAQSQRISWLYWWLFQTQHISCWKERNKNNLILTILGWPP